MVSSLFAYSQQGIPFIKNYSIEDYKSEDYTASGQNWSIVQDSFGFIYAANTGGIIQYDGVSWTVIAGTENIPCNNLVLGQDNIIYAGMYDSFGYLEPDSIGRLHYVSLNSLVPDSLRDYLYPLDIAAIDDKIFFVTPGQLFIYHDGSFEILNAEVGFYHCFKVKNNFYIWDAHVGIKEYLDGELKVVRHNAIPPYKSVNVMLPIEGNGTESFQILIGTDGEGLYIMDEDTVVHIESELEKIIDRPYIYCGYLLPDNNFIFGIKGNGAFIVNERGEILNKINIQSGLHNQTVYDFELDRQNGLWMGMGYGISRIEPAAPLTIFDYRHFIQGSVYDISRYNGILYLATDEGIYYLDEENPTNTLRKFENLGGSRISQAWHLLTAGDMLLLASTDGIFEINKTEFNRVSDLPGYYIQQSLTDENRFYVGTGSGLFTIYKKSGDWILEDTIIEHHIVKSILETYKNTVWASFYDVFRINFDAVTQEVLSIDTFDAADGLPEVMYGSKLYFLDDKLRIGTSDGLFYFDEEKNKFFPDSSFGAHLITRNADPVPLVEDNAGNKWTQVHGTVIKISKDKSGVITLDSLFSLRIPKTQIWSLYPEEDGIMWIGADDGLYRYDDAITRNYNQSFNTFIRKVTISNDSVVFNGVYFTEENKGDKISRRISLIQPEILKVSIPYKLNDITFNFAATSFDDESRNMYQYYLGGYDDPNDDWHEKTFKRYSNIPEGSYKFHVRGKNVYGTLGEEAVYEFTIAIPWAKSNLAYFIYVLVLGGLLFLIVKLYTARLKAANIVLEMKVGERTYALQEEVIVRKKAEEHKEKLLIELEKVNQELKHFAYVVAHDLKSPLRGIGALAEWLNTDYKDKFDEKGKEMIMLLNTRVDRVHFLIEGILEYSTIGKEAQDKTMIDLNDLLPEIIDLLVPDESISISIQEGMPSVLCIRTQVIQLFQNLLSNAIKFMDKPKGQIDIRFEEKGNNWEFNIADNGPGIDKRYHEKIFQIFQTLKAKDEYESTGIGLAVVSKVLLNMGGKIWVESKLGKGTTFYFTISKNYT